jgi:hypothetical protein
MGNIEELIVDCSISGDQINIIFKDNQNEEEQKIIHDFLKQLATNICMEGE